MRNVLDDWQEVAHGKAIHTITFILTKLQGVRNTEIVDAPD